jgi:hypothetical protein
VTLNAFDSQMGVPSTTLLTLQNSDVLESRNHTPDPFYDHIQVPPDDLTIHDVSPVSEGQHGVQALDLDQAPHSGTSPTRRAFAVCRRTIEELLL